MQKERLRKNNINRTGALREDLRLIPTSHLKKQQQQQKLDMTVLLWKSHCIVRDKVDPRACWPANLVESVSLEPMRHLHPKKNKKVDGLCGMTCCIRAHLHTCRHLYS